MNREHVECEFHGFDPEYEFRAFVTSVIEKLYLSAPSDAAMKLAIEKTRGAVKASCRIASQVGTFFAESTGESPTRALLKLERRIKIQIDSWKLKRFEQAV